MTPEEIIRTRWGIPDWTRSEDYPNPVQTSDLQWRWEFQRRHPDYRQKWETVSSDPKNQPIANYFGNRTVLDPISKQVQVMKVLIDPACSMTEDAVQTGHTLGTMFCDHGFIVTYDHPELRYCSKALVDYRFSLAEPLRPQIEKAESVLREAQEKHCGTKNTTRPSRELWPLYLRVLDARECGISWKSIGHVFWPGDKGSVKDKARRTHEQAMAVRDNFPI